MRVSEIIRKFVGKYLTQHTKESTMEHPLSIFHYCPRCGSARFAEHNDKSKQCQDCGFTFYINPSAATVAFILRKEPSHWSLLVVRRGKEPAKGTLDLPGGFSDIGETSEEGVIREVREETGLKVVDVKFLFSLPNRYLYSGLMVPTMDMFYLCQVENDDEVQAMDDAAEAMWVPLQDLSPEQFGLTSVRQGVEKFLANFPI